MSEIENHIICGGSAAGTLRQYLKQDLGVSIEGLITFPDNLCIGPLISFDKGEAQFIASREQFWRNKTFDPDHASYVVSDLHLFFQKIAEVKKATLWLAPGAHDQFMWSWLTHVFEHYSIDWENIKIKHLFNESWRKFKFIGLGELKKEDFALCQDFRVEGAHISLLKESYAALCASTPEQIVELANRPASLLPELQGCLKAYLRMYPDYKTGLSIFDKALLVACNKRLKSARVVAEAFFPKEGDERLSPSDSHLFYRLVHLSQMLSTHPLIELFGTVKDSSSMRSTEVLITEDGKRVLEGIENNAVLNSLDEYIGGVHLNSEKCTAHWFYKDDKIVRI